MESSGRTAHAVDTNQLVAAMVSGPKARFAPRAAGSSHSEHSLRMLKRLALSFGFLHVGEWDAVTKGRLGAFRKHSLARFLDISSRWLCECFLLLFSGGFRLSCLLYCSQDQYSTGELPLSRPFAASSVR